jgi:hypothetical protein
MLPPSCYPLLFALLYVSYPAIRCYPVCGAIPTMLPLRFDVMLPYHSLLPSIFCYCYPVGCYLAYAEKLPCSRCNVTLPNVTLPCVVTLSCESTLNNVTLSCDAMLPFLAL